MVTKNKIVIITVYNFRPVVINRHRNEYQPGTYTGVFWRFNPT